MPTLYLVRHAKPAAGWGEDPDPGLDAMGVTQAKATACALSERLDPLPVFTSPMRRCRETATPLMQRWGHPADLLPEVAEIPSPVMPASERREWLATAMAGSWEQMQRHSPPGSPDFQAWRISLLAALANLQRDSVIFSHFIAINAIVGKSMDSDAVISFRPDHASVTVIDSRRDGFRVVDLGREAQTSVLTRA